MKAWRQKKNQQRWLNDLGQIMSQRIDGTHRVGRMCRDSKERILPVPSFLFQAMCIRAGLMVPA